MGCYLDPGAAQYGEYHHSLGGRSGKWMAKLPSQSLAEDLSLLEKEEVGPTARC